MVSTPAYDIFVQAPEGYTVKDITSIENDMLQRFAAMFIRLNEDPEGLPIQEDGLWIVFCAVGGDHADQVRNFLTEHNLTIVKEIKHPS